MNIKTVIRKLIPQPLLSFYHYLLALTGALMYGFPARKLTVIGITGTSGKSSTVDFVTKILQENSDKVASISSVRFIIGDKEWKNDLKMTMPGRFKIQKFLRQAVDQNCKYVVLEITSEGIKQFRHKFIHLHTAVFTNLSPEHIEAHGGFENYRKAKLRLFKEAKKVHIINNDDQNAKYFLDMPAAKKITFGIQKSADIQAQQVSFDNGIHFQVQGELFTVNLIGDFNAYNALCAIATALSFGVTLSVCKKALEKVAGIPGRMEIVSKKPLVVVDYAHTPEQLELAYKSLQAKPLICVLGSCGGGRDKWKRPVLGSLAGQYCKEIIITNEDPYDEDPLEIMEQVASQIDNQAKPYHIIIDRKEAIKKALLMVKNDETVVITGKGSEIWMCLADGKKIPWSDAQIVKDSLNT